MMLYSYEMVPELKLSQCWRPLQWMSFIFLNCDFCRKQENMGSATHTVCLLLCFWVSGSCYKLQTVGPCTVNRETVRKNNTHSGLFCSLSQSKCCYIRSILFVGTCFLFSVTEVYPVCKWLISWENTFLVWNRKRVICHFKILIEEGKIIVYAHACVLLILICIIPFNLTVADSRSTFHNHTPLYSFYRLHLTAVGKDLHRYQSTSGWM